MQNISKNKKNSVFEVFFLPFEKNVVFLQPQNGGTVAQLVEQRTENPRVTGSIPVGTTKNLETQWLRLFICIDRMWLPYNKDQPKRKKHLPKGKCFFIS